MPAKLRHSFPQTALNLVYRLLLAVCFLKKINEPLQFLEHRFRLIPLAFSFMLRVMGCSGIR